MTYRIAHTTVMGLFSLPLLPSARMALDDSIRIESSALAPTAPAEYPSGMRDGPDIARIGALLGDPARTHMLTALMGGVALTAGELAREARVTPQTASSHLAQLLDGGLVTARKQGRYVYYALARREVAELMESLAGLATAAGHRRTRPGPKDPAMRRARVCYDHLAGELGVAMLDGLVARGAIDDRGGALTLTD